MLRKQETRSARYFGRALLRFYWERRRNMYDKTDIEGVPFFWDRMNIKDNVPMVNVTDPSDYIRPHRKRLKYGIRHVINMRRAALDKGLW